MSIQYTIEQREAYLYFVGHGTEKDLDENKKIHQMILETCKQYACSRVLVDDRQVRYTASTVSIYELAGYYKRMGASSKLRKVAVVASDEYHKDNMFYENVSRNRGINLRVFYDFNEAEVWLIET